MDIERRDFLKLAAGALTFSLAAESAWAQTNKIEVHWLGQSTTKITTLTGKVNVILVTHGHRDHTGDVAELQKRTGPTVLGPAGLVSTMVFIDSVTPEK